ncbi:MAG TPA: efflux RND transporter permease subunit, partial [Chloroflexota bacterium]|nr:efflux RND transporter permease subunit [Chloroflexota bacterium]
TGPEQLRSLVDDVVKPRLERMPGVAALEVTGGRVGEVHVELKAERLKAYGVPPQQVIQAIRTENLDVPGGRVPGGTTEELLRTSGRVQSLEQMGEVPVSTPRGSTVKLRELADLSMGYAEVRTISRLNGQESVVAEIRKQSGTNLVRVAEEVKEEIARLQQQYPHISIGISQDQSTFTRESVQDSELSLLMGGILAALVVLLFFRDLRNTLVTVAGLPVVVFGTFGILYAMGITLNIVTLMALSISIGMLIDDAIVVRENIFRHMEHGQEPREASLAGTAEIALAVMAVTFTIVAVFLPIAFTGGVTGKFLREFGITVVVAVLISLLEAFTLAPMLSAYFSHRVAARQDEQPSRFFAAMDSLNGGYRRLLEWSLGHRGVVVLVAVAALVATLAILPMMSRAFLPVVDQGEFGIVLEMPPGTRLEDTDRAAREAERVLLADLEVKQTFSTVGATPTQGSVDRAIIRVKLKARGGTDRAIERLRPQLKDATPGARVRLEKQATTAAFGLSAPFGSLRASPIQFSVEGPDMGQLDQVSRALVDRLARLPGISDVDRSLKEGRPERVISVDRNRAADLAVSTAQVGSTVRTLVNGEKAGSFRGPEKDVDILVRLAEKDRSSTEQILQIPVVTGRGTQLPLSAVANVQVSTEPNLIDRQDRQRQVLVGAAFTGRDMGTVLERAREAAREIPVPEGTVIRLAGDAEYMDDAFGQLYLAVALSLVFVYMILASQFASFIHPLTIMLALPFSIVGAMGALLASRFSLDMLGMIGVMLLMGLVAKNSILLVEFANQLKRQGLSTREAVLRAGPVRLRPILMTTLAMIFGMAPAAAGLGAGAELRQP